MRYYVIGDDGQKYGPADIPALNQWIAEGRLLQSHALEEETTGRRVPASGVAGLMWNVAQTGDYIPPSAPGGYPGYYQAPTYGYGDYGAEALRKAWTWAVLSLVCCGVIGGAFGIYHSMRAKEAGNPSWMGPFIVSLVGILVNTAGSWFLFRTPFSVR